MAKKILITGGTGYIGSHTAVELILQGLEVFIVDNLSNSSISVLDGIEKITGVKPYFVKLDLTDEKETKKYFEDHPGLDSVIHFAALKAVGESVSEPLKYYKNNLESLINLLKGMLDNGVSSLVFS
jgi:UDP-glucose 4-epimerase